jgi:cytochrome c biogenesis protein CcmG/thiol:disulfide interchange protein DsbE
MHVKRILLVVCSLGFFGMRIIGQQTITPNFIVETARPADKIKKEFPYDIQLRDADGKLLNSETVFKKNKKATVLLFWMSTCWPCRMELKAISEKFSQWKQKTNFEFYAISLDFADRVEQFNTKVKESNWPFPAYHDFNGEFRSVMDGGLNGLPQLFLLNKKGQVIYHTRKYTPGDEDKLFDAIKGI